MYEIVPYMESPNLFGERAEWNLSSALCPSSTDVLPLHDLSLPVRVSYVISPSLSLWTPYWQLSPLLTVPSQWGEPSTLRHDGQHRFPKDRERVSSMCMYSASALTLWCLPNFCYITGHVCQNIHVSWCWLQTREDHNSGIKYRLSLKMTSSTQFLSDLILLILSR